MASFVISNLTTEKTLRSQT